MRGRAGVRAAFALLILLPLTARAGAPLDVPFVEQDELLCGGAAAAMVLRHGGETGILAEDFAPLVDAAAGGIATDVLIADLQARGHDLFRLRGEDAEIPALLAAGQPVLALLRVGSARYHYVVVIGWDGERVLFHDPAVGPSQSLPHDRFLADWRAADAWGIVVFPRAVDSAEPAPAPSHPCLARSPSDARACLEALLETDPRDAAAHRALAKLAFRDGRFDVAASAAQRAAELAPADSTAWRILATARYLREDRPGALAAWNRVGEPRVDLIEVRGLKDTRHRAATTMMGIQTGEVLQAAQLRVAERRLAQIPAVALAAVRFRTTQDGGAQIQGAVLEESRVGLFAQPFRTDAIAAPLAVRLTVHNLARAGESWTAGYEYWDRRERAELVARVPALGGRSFLTTVAGGRQRETFADATSVLHRWGQVSLSHWRTAGLRGDVAAGWHRLDADSYGLLGVGLDQRVVPDLLAFRPRAVAGVGEHSFGLVALGAAARLGGRLALEASGDAVLAGRGAPRAFWPGAGTGYGRASLLRAHPLLDDDGVLDGHGFARTLLSGTLEAAFRVATFASLTKVGVAVFADAARPGDRDPLLDVGVGLRLRLPVGGDFHLDAAHSVTDGEEALSLFWRTAWPGWSEDPLSR